MSVLDWVILVGTLVAIVAYGTWKSRKFASDVSSYLLSDRESRWWTMGLSIMATQASAITFLSVPGQAFWEGMGFVQFYFGLPLATIFICIFFIPAYLRLKIYTAYEFLEQRFDLKTRVLAATLFLMQRGLAAGITIFAPSIILSIVLGWPLNYLIFVMGGLCIIYTVSGGTKAVNITQKQQMLVIIAGLVVAFLIALYSVPAEVSFKSILRVAKSADRLNILDFSVDPKNKYTFWSGITGGFFLMLSYLGTDQSQVQRYISGKSVEESRKGLLFNGFLKIPMQFFILFIGVVLFVVFQYKTAPLNFNPIAEKTVRSSPYSKAYEELESRYIANSAEKKAYLDLHNVVNKKLENRERQLREEAKAIIKKADPRVETNDKDYVFIYFIVNFLPIGFLGILLAAILSAAMSSTASELSALGTTTTIDLYKRTLATGKSDKHYLRMSKLFTLFWGIVAIIFANLGGIVENLIQLVNIIGSVFYGTLLGLFTVGFFIKYVRGTAVFWSGLATQITIIAIYYFTMYNTKDASLGYLWLNAIGLALVVSTSLVLQWTLDLLQKKPTAHFN